jgi:S-adenosyl methyltransferase
LCAAIVDRLTVGGDIIEPGVVAVSQWRPVSDLVAAAPSSMWCGVARKP